MSNDVKEALHQTLKQKFKTFSDEKLKFNILKGLHLIPVYL